MTPKRCLLGAAPAFLGPRQEGGMQRGTGASLGQTWAPWQLGAAAWRCAGGGPEDSQGGKTCRC